MIVPMQRVTVLCTASAREAALARLQDLGVLHADATDAEEPSLKAAQVAVDETQEALRLVTDAAGEPDDPRYAACAECAEHVGRLAAAPLTPPVTVANILELGAEEAALEAEIDRLDDELARYLPFGEFDPAAARELLAAGIAAQLFRAPLGEEPVAGAAGGLVRVLRREDSHVVGVAIGRVELGERVERIPWPARGARAARAPP